MADTTARPASVRDHLFISYAWEDVVFARWLALRLTAEGYKVWIDQFKLLGGESWPRDIDEAIKDRTFRVLGLLSRHSIAKPNPLKERTLALNIAKQAGMGGFLIPLNVDGLPSKDLDWMTSDITFIPFASSWAQGLLQLRKLLEREGCPKQEGDGKEVVTRIALGSDVISRRPEKLLSNVAPFIAVPESLRAFIVTPGLQDRVLYDAQRDWACYPLSSNRVLAFHPPGEDLATWLRSEPVQDYHWRSVSRIGGVKSRDVVVNLLRGSVESRLQRLGYQWSSSAGAFALPGPLRQTMAVLLPDATNTTVRHSGERTFFRVGQPKIPYRYRLALKLEIAQDLVGEFSLICRFRFHLTDASDVPLPENQRLSRRKHLTRNWFNRHWMLRHLAVMQHLADSDGLIRVGDNGSGQVILDCRPAQFEVDRGIDESKLEPHHELGDDVPVVEASHPEPLPEDSQDA